MHNDILNVIAEKYPSMSKGHRSIANYITENYNKAAFITAAKLADWGVDFISSNILE